jgi:hypothetical protein
VAFSPSICSVGEEVIRPKVQQLLLRLNKGEIKRLGDIVLEIGRRTVLETEDGRLLDQLVVILDDGKPHTLIKLLSRRGVTNKKGGVVLLNDLERRLRRWGKKQLLHMFSVVTRPSPSLPDLLAQRGECLCNSFLDFSNWL